MSRDKDKSLNERHQAILSALLKDEDNKYCVDCDAKGPRWASWNLGIFLCIRCAGIHRNLGVHISRVKSVNLDTWTPEQIAMMQEMGNSRARAVYEANLPDHFRRPQTDSSLEAFIRAKYENKKYIAKEWVPPQPKVNPIVDEKKEKKRSRSRPASSIQLPSQPKANSSTDASKQAPVKQPPKVEAAAKPAASVDLLGLDTPAVAPVQDDPFGEFLSNTSTPAAPVANSNPSASSQLLDGGAGVTLTENGVAGTALTSEQSLMGGENGSGGSKSTKESILALYGSGSSQQQQQQMFGVPGGVYMPQQQPNQQYGMMPGMQNCMMGNMMQGNMGMAQMQQQQPPQQAAAANMMPGMQQMMMAQNVPTTAMYPFGHIPSQNMMVGGAMQGQGMMAGQVPNNMMMGGANMYNMGGANMYNMQQAQMQQLQQVQQQMAGMKIGSQPGMVGYPQQGAVTAGAGGWTNQQSGHTLSNNLWQ